MKGSAPRGSDKRNTEKIKNKSLPSLFCYLEAKTWFHFFVTMYGKKDPFSEIRGERLHHQIDFPISHLVTIPFGTTQRSEICLMTSWYKWAGDLPQQQQQRLNRFLCLSLLVSPIGLPSYISSSQCLLFCGMSSEKVLS